MYTTDLPYNIVAQAYGSSNYGSCNYNDGSTCTSTGTTTTTTSSGGTLVNTGTMVIAFVALAAFIIFIALIVRIWRRPKKSATPPVGGTTGTAETISGEHRKI